MTVFFSTLSHRAACWSSDQRRNNMHFYLLFISHIRFVFRWMCSVLVVKSVLSVVWICCVAFFKNMTQAISVWRVLYTCAHYVAVNPIFVGDIFILGSYREPKQTTKKFWAVELPIFKEPDCAKKSCLCADFEEIDFLCCHCLRSSEYKSLSILSL